MAKPKSTTFKTNRFMMFKISNKKMVKNYLEEMLQGILAPRRTIYPLRIETMYFRKTTPVTITKALPLGQKKKFPGFSLDFFFKSK